MAAGSSALLHTTSLGWHDAWWLVGYVVLGVLLWWAYHLWRKRRKAGP